MGVMGGGGPGPIRGLGGLGVAAFSSRMGLGVAQGLVPPLGGRMLVWDGMGAVCPRWAWGKGEMGLGAALAAAAGCCHVVGRELSVGAGLLSCHCLPPGSESCPPKAAGSLPTCEQGLRAVPTPFPPARGWSAGEPWKQAPQPRLPRTLEETGAFPCGFGQAPRLLFPSERQSALRSADKEGRREFPESIQPFPFCLPFPGAPGPAPRSLQHLRGCGDPLGVQRSSLPPRPPPPVLAPGGLAAGRARWDRATQGRCSRGCRNCSLVEE